MISHHEYPYRHTVIDSFMPKQAYDVFRDKANRFISDSPSSRFLDYDAQSFSISQKDSFLTDGILNKGFFEIVQKRYALEHTLYVDAAIHVHGPGSRSGWRHNDFNFGYFANTNAKGLIYSDNAVCHYRTGKIADGLETSNAVVKFVRSLACLFYFDNNWVHDSGGETLVAMHQGCQDCKYDKLVAPIDNRLLMFECSPFSYHCFQQTAKSRKSLIFWLHSSLEHIETKWPLSEIVPW